MLAILVTIFYFVMAIVGIWAVIYIFADIWNNGFGG